ncbi:MAG TPA: metallophosphoesterase family protein [Bryobacteraceae bacterium]|nr:metallophosphoesterase family protein [Bryobacteraceae bacterium]
MRILIVADIHANAESLQALPKEYDQLWVLGDLVNYGPDPGAVVEFVRERADVVIQGNHDYAIGCHADPQCSEPYRKLAEAMARFTDRELSNDDKHYLAGLPLSATPEVDGMRFFLCHAAPSDPLFAYVPANSDRWHTEIGAVETDILLCGHTHTPFLREIEGSRVVNPGSLGQPKTGVPKACYALWDSNEIVLRQEPYDYKATISAIRAISSLGVSHDIKQVLAHILETGGDLPGIGS